jgi:hypothetical protein
MSSQEQLFSTYASRFGTRIAMAIFEIYGWKYRRILRKANKQAKKYKAGKRPLPK